MKYFLSAVITLVFFFQTNLKADLFELSECLERTNNYGKIEKTDWLNNLKVTVNLETNIISLDQISDSPYYNKFYEYKLENYTSDLIIGRSYFDHPLLTFNSVIQGEIFIDLKNKEFRQTSFPKGLMDINVPFMLQNGQTMKKIEERFRKDSWKTFCKKSNLNQEGNEESDDILIASSGTAFFISNKGHLLTNNHVVDGCKVSKITYQDKDYDTQLIATDKTLDLALLKADLRNKSYLNFSGDEAKKMQKIYVGGYPLGKGLSDDLKISSGIVSSLKGFEDNSNEIQIDAAINPGNSGGPIINEDGELVAIAVSGMSKDKTEGINFGIKASAAERFLKSNDLKASSSFFSSSKNNDELLEILEEATVYTYCN